MESRIAALEDRLEDRELILIIVGNHSEPAYK